MNNEILKRTGIRAFLVLLLVGICVSSGFSGHLETAKERDARMAWWREARFGLFIHWGLYAIPAGEWQGETKHAEWIRTTAQIPIDVYDKFTGQFNPTKFNARQWARLAKEAGMKYIVITSKHHDGFCLFDSGYTDFDVMSTPFKRDIMKELAGACRKEGIKICWYHSIMDWHHPDYLPRRDWEKNRSTEGANFPRYVQYMKNQLRELVKNYGEIGVLWFDGEWESTWNQTLGKDLYDYVSGLQPDIIINNRVGAGRAGMAGLTKKGEFAGDFGTPEQQIPGTGLPGVDWETCMTMNDHWGYNSHDLNWKSAADLIRKLVDIASKGGNFLLNVGPTAAGQIPRPSIDRLRAIGRWMKVNGESIYGTRASPFKHLPYGRCTRKSLKESTKITNKSGPIQTITRLYLHVFRWPDNGKLFVPGIFNKPIKAYLLDDPQQKTLPISRVEDALVVAVPPKALDSIDTVVVLDIEGKPDVNDPPGITADTGIFVDKLEAFVNSERENVRVRCTLDGSIPNATSPLVKGPLHLTETTTVTARCFRDGKAVSGSTKITFKKVKTREAVQVQEVVAPGLACDYFEGKWERLPDFSALVPIKKGVVESFDLSTRSREDYFGFVFHGFIRIPEDGVYIFYTDSDDGSRLYIGQQLLVDNDGLHGMTEEQGVVALAAGLHPIRVTFFEKTGSIGLQVSYKGPGIKKQPIPDSVLVHRKSAQIETGQTGTHISAREKGLLTAEPTVKKHPMSKVIENFHLYSYYAGTITTAVEFVSMGCKQLALSPPLSDEEFKVLIKAARMEAKKYGIPIYVEKDLLVTRLFDAGIAKGKTVIFFAYNREVIDRYLALKKFKEKAVKEGRLSQVEEKIAWKFGKLLSYTGKKIKQLLTRKRNK